MLESAGDLDGLAEALLVTGRIRGSLPTPWLPNIALQRAADCARQSGNHRAEREAGTWLTAVLLDLPVPAQEAVGRAERLLEAAAGDPWAEAAILQPLIMWYGQAGRFGRRPRGLPARPAHTHRRRGGTRLGNLRQAGRA